MKKVLLTTTALVMTAGVASAEITFSGKGEAGVYRLAPTAATTGTTGVMTQAGTGTQDTTLTSAGVATAYSAATHGSVALTTGTAITVTAATGTASTATATTLANALADLSQANAAVVSVVPA